MTAASWCTPTCGGQFDGEQRRSSASGSRGYAAVEAAVARLRTAVVADHVRTVVKRGYCQAAGPAACGRHSWRSPTTCWPSVLPTGHQGCRPWFWEAVPCPSRTWLPSLASPDGVCPNCSTPERRSGPRVKAANASSAPIRCGSAVASLCSRCSASGRCRPVMPGLPLTVQPGRLSRHRPRRRSPPAPRPGVMMGTFTRDASSGTARRRP
jgi:hypothetical protein